MKKSLFFSIVLLLVSGPSFAQGLSGETEVGTNGNGGSFFSQYVFYDFSKVNVLTRYFYVNGVLERGEFSLGPTIGLGNGRVLKFQFGGTTDEEVQVAGLLVAKVKGHGILYIADGKLAIPSEQTHTFYQKLFVALTDKTTWQFRVEHLQVGKEQGFLRIGLEYQQGMPNGSHLYIAPFYDPINEKFGSQVGFRFF